MTPFKINTMEDVDRFLHYVMLPEPEGLGLQWDFHPDDDFTSYGRPDADLPRFSEEEGEQLNLLIDRCFEICDKYHKDIYHLALEIQRNECE